MRARPRVLQKKTLFCGHANDNSTRQTEFPPSFANFPRSVPRFAAISLMLLGGEKRKPVRSLIPGPLIYLCASYETDGRRRRIKRARRNGRNPLRFEPHAAFFCHPLCNSPSRKNSGHHRSLSLNRACSRVSLALNAKVGHRADDCSFGGSVFGS